MSSEDVMKIHWKFFFVENSITFYGWFPEMWGYMPHLFSCFMLSAKP